MTKRVRSVAGGVVNWSGEFSVLCVVTLVRVIGLLAPRALRWIIISLFLSVSDERVQSLTTLRRRAWFRLLLVADA